MPRPAAAARLACPIEFVEDAVAVPGFDADAGIDDVDP